jgi:hypothetical protein
MELNAFTEENLAGLSPQGPVMGAGITLLSMHDTSAIGRSSRAVFVECRTCGYEPPSEYMPHGRCPKCFGYSWRYALKYTVLPTPQG